MVGYSRADIELWAEVVARSLTMAGIHNGDTIQIAYGYDPFTGDLVYTTVPRRSEPP